MADNIRLITYAQQTVTPMNDAILQDVSVGKDGILHGAEVTVSGNSIAVSSGYGVIRGRLFEISSTTIPVTLSSSGTSAGRLYVKLDLSNTDEPITLLTAVATGTLPELEKDYDANYTNGVYELELATFSVGSSNITNLVRTVKTIHGEYVAITTEGTSMDDYTDHGIYTFSSTYAPSNLPSGVAAGWFFVIGGRGTALRQILLQDSTVESEQYNIYTRAGVNGTWTSWARFVSEDEIYYQPGETTTIHFAGAGYITAGTADVRFQCPWAKSVAKCSGVRVVSGQVTLRQNNAYLANGVTLVQRSGTSGNCYPELMDNGLWMTFTKNGGWGGTNNSAVGITGEITVLFV